MPPKHGQSQFISPVTGLNAPPPPAALASWVCSAPDSAVVVVSEASEEGAVFASGSGLASEDRVGCDGAGSSLAKNADSGGLGAFVLTAT
jgi:hypothetical protein